MKALPLLLGLALAGPVLGADGQAKTRHDAAAPVDPTYEQIAKATGGRVYDMRKPEDASAFQRDIIDRPRREQRERFWKSFLSDPRAVSRELPLPEESRPWIYALIKFLAYSGWCWVGLRLAGAAGVKLWRAGLFGLLRGALGLLFGAGVFAVFLALRWAPPDSAAWYAGLYLGIYVPVRWVEWSALDLAIGVKSRRWRAQGIAVSFAADLVQMAMFGSMIPVGRFMC